MYDKEKNNLVAAVFHKTILIDLVPENVVEDSKIRSQQLVLGTIICSTLLKELALKSYKVQTTSELKPLN